MTTHKATEEKPTSPFAEPAQQADAAAVPPPEVVEEVNDGPESYKVVRTATGKNYVEANDYDPLEHHRTKDRSKNKGEGLGFMCCCAKPRVTEPGMDRHYSMNSLDAADKSAGAS